MGKPKDREGEAEEFKRHYAHVAERQMDEQQNEQGSFEFKDAGEDETLPGQEEIEAGSVQHEQVLKSFPNATHYAPDVNVVVPEPPAPPAPPDPEVEDTRSEGEDLNNVGRDEEDCA